jgi:DNA-directed RNA polymerase I, II, and III subunit RPABC1
MEQLSRLWRVRKTVCKMLDDRGFIIGEDDLDMTLDQFKERYTEQPK